MHFNFLFLLNTIKRCITIYLILKIALLIRFSFNTQLLHYTTFHLFCHVYVWDLLLFLGSAWKRSWRHDQIVGVQIMKKVRPRAVFHLAEFCVRNGIFQSQCSSMQNWSHVRKIKMKAIDARSSHFARIHRYKKTAVLLAVCDAIVSSSYFLIVFATDPAFQAGEYTNVVPFLYVALVSTYINHHNLKTTALSFCIKSMK